MKSAPIPSSSSRSSPSSPWQFSLASLMEVMLAVALGCGLWRMAPQLAVLAAVLAVTAVATWRLATALRRRRVSKRLAAVTLVAWCAAYLVSSGPAVALSQRTNALDNVVDTFYAPLAANQVSPRHISLAKVVVAAALVPWAAAPPQARAQEAEREVFVERAAEGKPHQGKVLLAVQAHSDDIPLMAAGTVAKLVNEGYAGYLVRATNDDMGDAPGLGTPGTIGENVLGNERDNAEVAHALGLAKVFDLNYSNHRMGDVSQNELQCRLIFLIRLLKVDTVVCWDPWAHDEENPDHYQIARGVEAACWMAGRSHDYPEQFAAGLEPHTVKEKYYYARRPEINRVVDVSGVVDQIVAANRANRAKGPAGRHGSRLRAALARQGKKLPLLGDDDESADRNYIRQFILARSRELGRKHGFELAEGFHYIGGQPGGRSALEEYIERNAVKIE